MITVVARIFGSLVAGLVWWSNLLHPASGPMADLADSEDEFNVPGEEGVASDQDAASGCSGGRGRGRRGKGRGKGKKGRGGRCGGTKKASKKCFAQGCDQKPRAHSKFCQPHRKDAEAMRYQAKSKDEQTLKTVEEVLADPAKAAMALSDFARENPAGRFRKKLIDWTSFSQKFGKRAEVRMRGTEELMDVSDFVYWQRTKGKSEEEAMTSWKEHLESDLDREGEGANTKLWIVKNKQRFKDTVHYKDEGMEEGSKPIKDINDSDRLVSRLNQDKCCDYRSVVFIVF